MLSHCFQAGVKAFPHGQKVVANVSQPPKMLQNLARLKKGFSSSPSIHSIRPIPIPHNQKTMKMVQQQFPSSSFHLILLVLGLLLVGCLAENWQLSGQILCYDPDTEPESHYKGLDDVDVEFWEFDTMDPDDFLNKTNTDIGGFFKVTGEENEYTKTEPYLLVFHTCPDPKMPLEEGCQYQSRFELPPKPEQQFVHIGVGDREFAWSHKAGASQEGSEELAMSKKLKCP